LAGLGRDIADVSAQGDLRQHVRERDANRSRGRVKLRLGCTYIRPSLYQFRRYSDRDRHWQRQLIEPDLIHQRVARQLAGQGCQHVMLLIQALAQWRQRGLHLRQRSVLRQYIGFGNRAKVEFATSYIERLALQRNDLLGGLDLRAITRSLNSSAHNVRHKRQVGGVILVAAYIHQRLQRFNLPAIGAKQIRHQRDTQLRRVQRIGGCTGGQCRGQHLHGIAIAAGARCGLNRGEVGPTLRGCILARLA